METKDAQPRKPQVIPITRSFSSREPQIASITERMVYEFRQGSLERHLSIRYETRREMVEAVIRREMQRLYSENQALRRLAA